MGQKQYITKLEEFEGLSLRAICNSFFYEEMAVVILGYDYGDIVNFLIHQQKLPELDSFGNAISEKNRIEILVLMLQKDEITIKDLKMELNLSSTNAHYHLMLMMKVNIIKARNHGRTVLYSLNKQYFNAAVDILSKYSN